MRIEIGDIVTIYFNTAPIEIDCEVLYIPQATGDSWHLKREDGTIIYVNSFTKMLKFNEEK